MALGKDHNCTLHIKWELFIYRYILLKQKCIIAKKKATTVQYILETDTRSISQLCYSTHYIKIRNGSGKHDSISNLFPITPALIGFITNSLHITANICYKLPNLAVLTVSWDYDYGLALLGFMDFAALLKKAVCNPDKGFYIVLMLTESFTLLQSFSLLTLLYTRKHIWQVLSVAIPPSLVSSRNIIETSISTPRTKWSMFSQIKSMIM